MKPRRVKYALTRTVTPTECPWLYGVIFAGDVVNRYNGVTYGVIGDGIACTLNPDHGAPFFELPRDALREVQP